MFTTNCGAIRQQPIMTLQSEQQQMMDAGFEWDPSYQGYPRWTHSKTGTTVLRQLYMSNQQWDEHRAKKIAEVQSADNQTGDTLTTNREYTKISTWVIKRRDTEQYVTFDTVFGLEGAYDYTTDKLVAARFASREDAVKNAGDFDLTNHYVVEE